MNVFLDIMYSFSMKLYQLGPYILMGVMLILSSVKLISKKSGGEGKNCYGVDTATGEDLVFKKQSKIMIIAGIISIVIIFVGMFFHAVCAGNERYIDHRDNAQKYIDMANEYRSKAAYDATSLQEISRWLSAEDSVLEELEMSRADWISQSFSKRMSDVGWWLPELIAAVLFGILFRIYMIPAKVARKKEHEQTSAIVWLNAIFGCTLIMWIVMLIWANGGNKTQPSGGLEINQLADLKKLCDNGVITQEEFEQKKKDILNI